MRLDFLNVEIYLERNKYKCCVLGKGSLIRIKRQMQVRNVLKVNLDT